MDIYSFNPRPHMEGDKNHHHQPNQTHSFNPRPHMEGDERMLDKQMAYNKVSIHALTWRATYEAPIGRGVTYRFNPRPHMEGDSC